MVETCSVCGEPTGEHSYASCSRCARPYHLALRQDIPAKDCGQVWISEESLALDFACNTCLVAEGLIQLPSQPEAVIAPESTTRRYARRERVRASEVVRTRRRRPR
jgi:hypothetical protein